MVCDIMKQKGTSERGNKIMKKLLIILITVMLMFTLTACGNEEAGIEDNRTSEHFLQAFEDAGYELIDMREQEQPGIVQIIRAVDCVVFNLMLEGESILVELWQFDNEEALLRHYEHHVRLVYLGGE